MIQHTDSAKAYLVLTGERQPVVIDDGTAADENGPRRTRSERPAVQQGVEVHAKQRCPVAYSKIDTRGRAQRFPYGCKRELHAAVKLSGVDARAAANCEALCRDVFRCAQQYCQDDSRRRANTSKSSHTHGSATSGIVTALQHSDHAGPKRAENVIGLWVTRRLARPGFVRAPGDMF